MFFLFLIFVQSVDMRTQDKQMSSVHLCARTLIRIHACMYVYRGYGIGLRLIDELLAKSNVGACADLKETAEVYIYMYVCIYVCMYV
jgi:hypothetical protein